MPAELNTHGNGVATHVGSEYLEENNVAHGIHEARSEGKDEHDSPHFSHLLNPWIKHLVIFSGRF